VLKFPLWKILISGVVTCLALVFALPNLTQIKSNWLPSSTVNLGLDLRGGSHLLLDVDFDSYLNDLMETNADALRKLFREEKVGYRSLLSRAGNISFELRENEDAKKVKQVIGKIDSNLSTNQEGNYFRIFYEQDELDKLTQKVIDQSIEIIRLRVDSTGTKEPIIQRQGNKHILLQVPGEENPQNLKNVLGKTAKLTFHLVDENASLEQALKGSVPQGSALYQGDNDSNGHYYAVVKKKVLLSGDQLNNAQAGFNQNMQPIVSFSFNNLGSKIFAETTKENRGKRLAIVLDNKLLSAPVINEPILGGSGQISGNFTVESANDLALLLRAGALPTPLKIIEERSIGPNLGSDSIVAGKKAGLIGFAAVCVFMMLTYGVLGIFANIALMLAMLYMLALLSVFQATLTLPGIAGIILTIGMAVDANVLIYERIREEVGKGVSNLYAVRQGFESAFATIADSNITTLVVAVLLYIFGVGAIKGFAVTLSIGILSSMFSAIIITKLLVDLWLKYVRPNKII